MKIERDEMCRILDRTLEMQKYIESKNAVLVTFIIAIVTIAKEMFSVNLSEWWHWILFIFALTALVAAIWSFVPIMQIKTVPNKHNIYFFGDIAKMTVGEYKELLTQKLDDEINEDVCKQIVINSAIVNRKIKLFKFSIRTLFIVTLLLYPYECMRKCYLLSREVK